MTIIEMFGQSGVLAFLGMAVVFLFLIILIVTMDIVAKLISALGWDSDVKKPAAAASSAGASSPNAAVVAAVGAAVNEYRKTNS